MPALDLIPRAHSIINAAAAGDEKGAAQAGLVEALLTSGTPVVVVSVRNPYDIRRFPAAPAYLCTYNVAGAVSLDACVRVLYGESTPAARSPSPSPRSTTRTPSCTPSATDSATEPWTPRSA